MYWAACLIASQWLWYGYYLGEIEEDGKSKLEIISMDRGGGGKCVLRDKMITRWSLIPMIKVFQMKILRWNCLWIEISVLFVFPLIDFFKKMSQNFFKTNKGLWNENETAVDSSLMSFLSTIEGIQSSHFITTSWPSDKYCIYLHYNKVDILIEGPMMRWLIVCQRRHLPFSIFTRTLGIARSFQEQTLQN